MKKKIKILHVTQLFHPSKGGIESVVKELVDGLSEHVDQVDVLCCGESNSHTVDYLQNSTVFYSNYQFRVARAYFSLSLLKTWVKLRNNYDLIHVHMPHPFANILFFLFRTNSKIVIHWHSDIVRQKWLKKLYCPLQRWLLTRANAIVATSPVYAASSEDLVDFEKKVTVIPIGINSSSLVSRSEDVESLRAAYPDKYIIFSLGRHVYYKGFKWLIESMAILPEKYVLLLGGTGPLTSELQALVDSLGLAERVFFVGKIPDAELGSYYAACDLFCLPSIERSEAFGVVQLEAMSFGKSVVSTNIPGSGVGWVNQDGVSGKVAPPRDAPALAAAITELCEAPLPAKQVREYFLADFTVGKMVNRIIPLYKECLGNSYETE